MCFNIRNIHSFQVVLVFRFLVVFGTYYYGTCCCYFFCRCWDFRVLFFSCLPDSSPFASKHLFRFDANIVGLRLLELWVEILRCIRLSIWKCEWNQVISVVADDANAFEMPNEIEWMFREIDKIKTEVKPKKGRIQQLFPFVLNTFWLFTCRILVVCFFQHSASHCFYHSGSNADAPK